MLEMSRHVLLADPDARRDVAGSEQAPAQHRVQLSSDGGVSFRKVADPGTTGHGV